MIATLDYSTNKEPAHSYWKAEDRSACVEQYRNDCGRPNDHTGLHYEATLLMKILLALDVLLSRPPDPAHSEYAGMTKQMHSLLIDTVLSTSAFKLYHQVLGKWPFEAILKELLCCSVHSPLERFIEHFTCVEQCSTAIVLYLALCR